MNRLDAAPTQVMAAHGSARAEDQSTPAQTATTESFSERCKQENRQYTSKTTKFVM
jgi:hypothetical protein